MALIIVAYPNVAYPTFLLVLTKMGALYIIIDGILGLALEEIRKLSDIKIFIKTEDDIRFIRRLTRDLSERGRTVESIIN